MKNQSNEPFSHALNRQKEIYLKGVSGEKPLLPLHLAALEEKAKASMSKEGFAYMAGGAGIESSILANRQGLDHWHIFPRMLRDVSVRDTSIDLFGKKLPAPFLLAPIGVLDLAHKSADLGVGKAAAKTGIPFVFSNQASVPMEKVAAAMGDATRWFQLYWSKDNRLVESLVKRAEDCGCSAIVLTLDTTMLGWRIRDLDLAYLPFLEGRGIAQYTSDPVFREVMEMPQPPDPNAPKRRVTLKTISTLIQLMSNYPGGFFENLTSGKPMKAVRTFINIYSRPSLQWEDLPFLRKITKLPILLKGILHPEDVQKAIQYGMDGVIVSNHGGRQVEGSISSIRALPGITGAAGDRIKVLFDSGIRTGSDIFKAIALGADAVLLGRPYAYALSIAGQRGVEELINNLIADFELTMGLAGCTSVREINRNCLVAE